MVNDPVPTTRHFLEALDDAGLSLGEVAEVMVKLIEPPSPSVHGFLEALALLEFEEQVAVVKALIGQNPGWLLQPDLVEWIRGNADEIVLGNR